MLMAFFWFVGFGGADGQVAPSLRSDSSRVGRDNLRFYFFSEKEKNLCARPGVSLPLIVCPVQVRGGSAEQVALN